jgi:hypothetical protein
VSIFATERKRRQTRRRLWRIRLSLAADFVRHGVKLVPKVMILWFVFERGYLLQPVLKRIRCQPRGSDRRRL